MAEIQAFGAMRFQPSAGELSQLTCPPYDIISDGEREAYLRCNPHNIIRLELPQEGENPYDTAGETLREWLDDGILGRDGTPALYLYQEEFSHRGKPMSITGLVCRVRLEEWEKGVVLPHEETLSKAKTDRLNLMRATGCNFSSIYSLYFDREDKVVSRIHALTEQEPDMAFSSADGILHRVWRVAEPAEIAAVIGAFGDKKLYIADGHHRYETAIQYRNELREQGICVGEDHPANFVMMTLVNMEHPGLVVFPTHRIVRDLEDFDAKKLLGECAAHFDAISCEPEKALETLEAYGAGGKKAFGFYHGGEMDLLILREEKVMEEVLPGVSDFLRGLDVSVLHSLILERGLRIDRENMVSQKNLIYTRSAKEAMAAVDKGEADCCFLINATKVAEIAGVASAGEKMPQKSTYFYPKLITGHLMNQIL